MKLHRNGRFAASSAAGLAALGLGLAGCSSNAGTTPNSGSAAQIQTLGPSSAYSGPVLTKPFGLPSGTFTTTKGDTESITAPPKGDLTLVFYGFTHCTDDCPTTMADISAAWHGLPAADQSRIKMDFVTVDPPRDTTAVMATWLARFNMPNVTGFNAAFPVTQASGASVDVDVEKPSSTAGDYQVEHGLQVLGYTSDGKAHIEWLVETVTVPQLKGDLERILSGAPIQ